MNVAGYADEYEKRVRSGRGGGVRVGLGQAELFLGELARRGFALAGECLDQISDPRLRRTIEAIFFSTSAFAVAGAGIGAAVASAPGARVGAAVGAGVGLVVGVVAVLIIQEVNGPRGRAGHQRLLSMRRGEPYERVKTQQGSNERLGIL